MFLFFENLRIRFREVDFRYFGCAKASGCGRQKKSHITEFRVVFKHFVRCGDKMKIVKRTKHAKVFCRDGKRQNCARVESLVARARAEGWFPTREKCNARGQPGVPLEILVLGSLRYLGKFNFPFKINFYIS
jgi:hypothetical protein